MAGFHCRVNHVKRLIPSPVRHLCFLNFDVLGWGEGCNLQPTPLGVVISGVRKFSSSLLQLSADGEIGLHFVFLSALLHAVNFLTEVKTISCIL